MSEYYNQETDFLLNKLDSSFEGLNSFEAKKRSKIWGKNSLPRKNGDNAFKILLRQFKSPLVYILLVTSFFVLFLGEFIDALVIFFVLFLNAIVGAIQEGKAQKTFLALDNFAKTKAIILRDSQEVILPDDEIVPGDIVVLREGEKVPADGRIISSKNLEINESSLTGESFPVSKNSEILEGENIPVSEQSNMAFKGSGVVNGKGLLLVVKTGLKTQIGQIAQDMKAIDSEMPLKKNIKKISNIVMISVLFLVLFLFLLSIFSGKDLKETFLLSIALAVSVIPEGLPIVLTLTLALGMKRMSQINILVKRMQAVEALGQVKVLAVDKTGTITKNELSVKEFHSENSSFFISGQGYRSEGKINFAKKEVDPLNHEKLLLAGKISIFCSGAHKIFDKSQKKWKIFGDPTEAAMSVFAEKVGFKKESLVKEMPQIFEIPFNHEKRFQLSVNYDKKKSFVSVVGAPENVLSLTNKYLSDSGIVLEFSKEEKQKQINKFHKLSQKGFRIISLAYFQKEGKLEKFENWEEIIFLGFLAIRDEMREGVFETVENFKKVGLRTIMITGDFEITAKEIAREAGIYKKGDKIITGKELRNIGKKELAKKLERVSVFARVSPQDKLKIIEAFKERDIKIAMSGDGVNDALSLMAADLGISMGKIGTEVAKEAADIVFLDDNFENTLKAFLEGRHIFNSIKRVSLFLISTSLGEVIAIFGAIFMGLPIMFTAVQIIWLNLVTDGFLDIALAMEPRREKTWKELRRFDYRFWDNSMTIRSLLMASVMGIFTILIFSTFWKEDLIKAMTMALTTLAAFQWFNAWNCRYRNKSIFSSGFLGNKFLILATFVVVFLQIIIIEIPFFQKALNTTNLSIENWLLIFLVTFSIVVVEEIRKLIRWILQRKKG